MTPPDALTVRGFPVDADTGAGVPRGVTHEVTGTVKGGQPDGAVVRAVLTTLRHGTLEERVVAEGPLEPGGGYLLHFTRPPQSLSPADETLTVRVIGSDGALIAQSTPVLSPRVRTRIDVRLPRVLAGPAEFTMLERQVGESLVSGLAALDSADEAVIAQVSEWLDVDPGRLTLYQQSRGLEAETGLPASMFYAMGRKGLPPAPHDLLDVPTHELHTTIAEAIADGIVDAERLGDLTALVEQLSERIIDRALTLEPGTFRSGLGEVLAAADVSHDALGDVLRRYRARPGSLTEFWEAFTQADESGESVDDDLMREVELAVRLGSILGNDPALLRRMQELRREGRWTVPTDLAGFTFDDWCDLVEELEPGGEEIGEAMEEAQERIESRAEDILDSLEEAFPNAFIERELMAGEEIGVHARDLLARAKGHNFRDGSIRELVAEQPALVEGLAEEDAEAAIEEVEAVERVSRVTDSAEDVAALVGMGIHSAMEIASMPPRHFIDLFDEAVGGRAQAARIHAQAQQAAAGAKMAAIGLLQASQPGPFVLGAPAIKVMPNVRSLFQTPAGFCDCEHCGSVYSPAAYFIDLLRYLNVTTPDRLEQLQARLGSKKTAPEVVAAIKEKLSRYQPLDVLLGRRPDLADLPLTCENTNTTLPYIDLVNELLEARVTGGNAAFDTGKTPADVLRAVPQNLSRVAYEQLRQTVHPLTLPYHQPLALARAYLAHLGVTRLELMRTLGRGEAAGDALVAEALGMSPEEFALVARPPQELWRHFGFASAQDGEVGYVDALAHLPTFLAATGVTFKDLIELVSTRFVNADNQLQLDTPGADCNPDTVRVAGLDEVRLSRMLRLIRLQRRAGLSFTDLDRALMALSAVELDTAALEKLTIAQDLAKTLDRPLAELLVLWGPIETTGKDNQYDRLFTTRAVTWRLQDERTFTLRRPDLTELEEPGGSLDAAASALLAGLRITSEELALIRALQTRRGTAPRLDIAGLSAIHRVVVLARALQLRLPALDLILRLAPPEADPFRPADPAATRRFVEIVRDVQASDFTPERLAYLFRHEWEPRRDPGPLPAQVEAVLANIRRGLADAFAETTQPAEVTGDTLRQKLALVLDAALVDRAIEVLDLRTPITAEKRREFFDRHLARLFPDGPAAATRLFTPAPAPAEGAAPAPEARWRANVEFVLEHLLPQLRTRQLRGAVIQTLGDTLGLSVPATARLIDIVLRSRQSAGEPLLRDFVAMLGSGLTGAYFANNELRGEPVVTRTDPELSFAWAGTAPAAGVPARDFSIRWTGYVLGRSKAPHTFYLRTDGAVRLVIKQDGTEKVVLDHPAGPQVVEHTSEPIALDPNRLAEIVLEYRNQGGPATLSLQFGTGPAAKAPIPTPNLYPATGLSTFAAVEQSYRRLHKTAFIVTGFGITDTQLEWLTTEPAFLNLDALPMDAADARDAVTLFGRWRQLAGLYTLRKKLPRSNTDLFDVFRAASLLDAVDRLVLATGWDRGTLEALAGPGGLALDPAAALRPPVDPAVEPLLLRLARAMDMQRRVGVAPATLYAWASSTPDADVAAAVVQAVKARYDEKRWLEVATALNDPLRAERRDALVAYLLPRMRDLGVTTRNQLFEYFLIDVDMNPCMLTSRIRQATGAVQTFFQRALMNLEPRVPPRVIDDDDWKWLKNYRVWEANRKVFLYPENWIEPELRDDKSPLFQALERAILQQEIKNDNVEAAFADYLEGLDEIARLDVRGVWFEHRDVDLRITGRYNPAALPSRTPPRTAWDSGTYHVFARTFNAPHVWYYRRLENGRSWTPWEKIDADIEGEHLVPVIYNRRLHLFWTMFREVSKTPPRMDRKKEGAPPTLGKDWEISLAYSVFDRGRWSRKRMSSAGVLDVGHFATFDPVAKTLHVQGTRILSPADYTVRAQVTQGELPQLQLYVYSRKPERMWTDVQQRRPAVHLSPSQVELVCRFDLNGCNGALVPDRAERTRGHLGQVGLPGMMEAVKRSAARAAVGTVSSLGRVRPFHLGNGGLINAPAGYHVHGMRFAAPHNAGGALLALSTGDARGLAVALPQARTSRRDVAILPVIDPKAPGQGGLYPFFFQDQFRSYFARPINTDWQAPPFVPMPLGRTFAPRVVSRRTVKPGLAKKGGGRGRREDVEDLAAFAPEAIDEWEDSQDAAWHPDDSAEILGLFKKKRRRQAAPAAPPQAAAPPPRRPAPAPVRRAPAPAPAPRRLPRAAPAPRPDFEQRLRFVPFEHADTCHLISTLKARGLEGLLDFSTTRPRQGTDHVLSPDGKWTPRPGTWFQRHYGNGPLVQEHDLPRLDVDFENDHPYSSYNWELFFHAPLQVAVRLAKDGRHEEAQRWFHFIFDPTTDSSSLSPRRYWRFAPFFANNEYDSAQEMMHLLSYRGAGDKPPDQGLLRRQRQVRDQLSAWWEKPFSPHVIARLRIAAYQKAVVMKYIDNLVEWGDKLFRRDTMESIQEATQIYILAANILGPRPERIPPIVTKQPLTFQRMRQQLNLFSNVEVRLENLQVRRPFRISARPDRSGATAILGMATQYFCTPPNPQLDKYWDTVADRLFKIRNCMNIQGTVRQLALFDPPIDPGLLVRAAAAGVDLGAVVASLNAPPPHYRFRFLLTRATRLAEEIRSFAAMALRVLEQKDAEGLASLRASNETALLEAVRDIRKRNVREVEEALAEQSLAREQVEIETRHITQQMEQLMSAPEEAQQKSLTAAKVVSGVAEGIDLVAKVMHAIPEFQTGAAGGFSSPFVTLQLGGQMFGDIAEAFAASVTKVMSMHETEADMAGKQAEYQRRREEWQHELELLNKEKAGVDKQIAETQIKLEIAGAELRRHELDVDNSKKVFAYLRDKYTNEQLYGWMLGQLSTVYFQAYKVAFDAAQQAERALRFERGDPSSSFIEFSYWDSLKKGLFAGERLLLDLRRMESAYVEGDRRALEITRHVSLRDEHPLAWVELLATGRCQIEITEALLDGDFPGHYFRRVKTVSLSATGTLKPFTNVNCTLTLLENRVRTDANASGAYPQSGDGEDARFLVNAAPIQVVATSRPDNDAGVFHLRFDDDRYLPFEGAGAISTWRIELPQSDNGIDLSQLGDLVLTLSYTARNGGAALEGIARADREKGLARGGIKPEPQLAVSLRRDLPALWKRLEEAPSGQEVEAALPLEADRFPGRYRGLDVRVERVTVFAHARGALPADALKLRLDPPKGSGTPIAGWTPPWPRSRTVRATGDVSGPAGAWKVALSAANAKVPELVDDIVFVFELRARKS